MNPKEDEATPGAEPDSAATAELDSLAQDAQRVDNGGQEPPQPGPSQPGQSTPGEQPKSGEHQISTARMVQGVLMGAGGLMATRYPALKRIYTEERCGMVGEAVAPVLDRWNINPQNSVAMQYLVAIGALVLLGMDSVNAIQASTHENGGGVPHGAPSPKPVP